MTTTSSSTKWEMHPARKQPEHCWDLMPKGDRFEHSPPMGQRIMWPAICCRCFDEREIEVTLHDLNNGHGGYRQEIHSDNGAPPCVEVDY